MKIIKVLKNAIQTRSAKINNLYDNFVFDDFYLIMKNSLVTELFLRGRKLNIYLVFVTQSYFTVPKLLD